MPAGIKYNLINESGVFISDDREGIYYENVGNASGDL